MEIVKKIWIRLVKLCGWKLLVPDKELRPEVDRCVFVVAPHTSAFDYIFGTAFLWSCSSNGKVLIKKEFFRWPHGPFLRSLGCISVDRGNRRNNIVGTAVSKFAEGGPLSIAITPEATRKAAKRWTKGFWEIARQAGVPIVPAYWDFKKKEIGVFDTIWPTDDFEADLLKVRKLYRKDMAKYPECFVDIHDLN